jgi:hypothetical protein
MRMTASCSGSQRTYRIQVCGMTIAPQLASSPRMACARVRSDQTAAAPREVPIVLPSSLSVLRHQGAAKHKRRLAATRQARLVFRSLDPFRALREPDRTRRDEERPLRLRTKNCQQNPNNNPESTPIPEKEPLDRKSPIQVMSERVELRASVIWRTGPADAGHCEPGRAATMPTFNGPPKGIAATLGPYPICSPGLKTRACWDGRGVDWM